MSLQKIPAVALSAAILLGGVASIAWAGPAAAKTKTHTISGSLSIFSDSAFDPKFVCEGSDVDGFNDLSTGAEVTVRNGSGKVIAVGELRQGRASDDSTCRMPFKVKAVPETPFYQIKIGNRGGIAYPLAKMRKKSWHVALTIGS